MKTKRSKFKQVFKKEDKEKKTNAELIKKTKSGAKHKQGKVFKSRMIIKDSQYYHRFGSIRFVTPAEYRHMNMGDQKKESKKNGS